MIKDLVMSPMCLGCIRLECRYKNWRIMLKSKG
jgi:hypothetical protein